MDTFAFQFDDIVMFELPSYPDVEAFSASFRPRWPGWSHVDEEVWLYAADLRERPDDLPDVLNSARTLLRDLGLAATRFYLDGRAYRLEAAPRPETHPRQLLVGGA